MRYLVSLFIAAAICQAQEPETPTFQSNVFGTSVAIPNGLEGKIYFIPPVNRLPIYTKTLNVPLTEFREGFPGITDRFEWFAIEYTGSFYVADPGKYNFRILCDDGSKLFIDGKLVIDLDNVGTFVGDGSIKLTAGLHNLRLDYFQGPRYHLELILKVQRPGGRLQLFNTDDFKPAADPTPATPTIEQPALPVAEQRSAIELAAQKAATYTSHVPDFLCTQVVDRTENRAKAGWKPRDVLTIQLSYANHAEGYRLTAVNNRPTKLTYESIGGAVSGGEFGSLIAEIFQPHVAKFDWDRLDKIRDQTVFVFRYSIQPEKSQYTIQYPVSRTETKRLVIGHHGLVFISPDDGSVLRVVRIADLPIESPIRDANTTVDYALTDVGGQSYLLPLYAENELSTRSIQTHNHVRFLNYRKFEAGSNISFDK
jgi:hypothetical protein